MDGAPLGTATGSIILYMELFRERGSEQRQQQQEDEDDDDDEEIWWGCLCTEKSGS